jgi:hypothetical protein
MPRALPRPALGLRRRSLAALSLGLGAAAVVLAGGSSSWAGQSASPSGESRHVGEALRPSSAEQLALVEHLRQKGAVVYGAWWCPHCFSQKNLFGTEAGQRLPYVECDKDDAGRARCQAAKIRAYPSWDLGGERREGVLSLEELKRWSGFSGSEAQQPAPAPAR